MFMHHNINLLAFINLLKPLGHKSAFFKLELNIVTDIFCEIPSELWRSSSKCPITISKCCPEYSMPTSFWWNSIRQKIHHRWCTQSKFLSRHILKDCISIKIVRQNTFSQTFISSKFIRQNFDRLVNQCFFDGYISVKKSIKILEIFGQN